MTTLLQQLDKHRAADLERLTAIAVSGKLPDSCLKHEAVRGRNLDADTLIRLEATIENLSQRWTVEEAEQVKTRMMAAELSWRRYDYDFG